MLRSVHITRFLSGILLIVFALGITPKRFLHDLLANHSHSISAKTSDAPCQLSNSGYSCDCDNLVAESVFISDQQVLSLPVFTYFASYSSRDLSFSSTSIIHSTLRGPPVNS